MVAVGEKKKFETVQLKNVGGQSEDNHSVTVEETSSDDSLSENDTKKKYGGKRPRAPDIDQQSSLVHVTYRSLPKKSKKKLEELLLGWSEWHSNLFRDDSGEELESGEETYYPALHLNADKLPTLSFLSDVPLIKKHCKGLAAFDRELVPLYDRGYDAPLCSDYSGSEPKRGLVVREDTRCFNCGSYDHSLKDCSKRRDNDAITNARKQFQAKKKGNGGHRNPTRYYQASPAGKFDGLKRGSLSVETKQLLGIGEQEPPPWHHKMLELGHPPEYIDVEAEVEEQPSGITLITGEEVAGVENNDTTKIPNTVEIKKSARFPGMNSSTAENADHEKWGSPHQRGVDIPAKKPNYLPSSELHCRRSMPDPLLDYRDLRLSRGLGVTSRPDSYEWDYMDASLLRRSPPDNSFWDDRGYWDARLSGSFRGSLPKPNSFPADEDYREDRFSRSLGISPPYLSYFSRSYSGHMSYDGTPRVFSSDPYMGKSPDRWGSFQSVHERFPFPRARDHLAFSFSPLENLPTFPTRTYHRNHLHDGY
ncbi:hypothetical protein QQ045_019609 [Rhodiola kirilowii]